MTTQQTDLREQLVTASISFLTAVTEIYGQEKGVELWGTIADTVDNDLKGDVFFALLSGKYARRNEVLMTGVNTTLLPANRVAIIKAIREADITRLGLKEAKDISDNLVASQPYTLSVDPLMRPAIVQNLRNLGITVPD